MSLETSNNVVTAMGTGGVGPFYFNFPFLSNRDILATRVDLAGNPALLVEGNDYTLTGAGTDNGGQITLTSALLTGYQLVIARILDLTQPTILPDGGPFFASTHEKALDRLAMLIQQIDEKASRGLRSRTGLAIPELTTATPGGIFAWNSNGTAIEYLLTAPAYVSTTVSAKSYGNDLSAAIAAIGSANVLLVVDSPITVNANAATHANTVIVVQKPGMLTVAAGKTLTINGGFSAGLHQIFNGTGLVVFVAGSVSEVLPQWWGAKGDGLDATATINYAAISAAIAAAPIGGRLRLVAGDYRTSATIDQNRQLKVVGDAGAFSGYGTQINRIGNFVTWYVHGNVPGKSYHCWGGMEGIYFGGYGGTTDVFVMDYLIGGTGTDIWVDAQTTGAGIFMSHCQDMVFIRPLLRNVIAGGLTARGQWRFGAPDAVDGNLNVNEIRIFGGHAESATPFLISETSPNTGRNNSVVFTNCKWEAANGAIASIVLDTVMGFQFKESRFNQYGPYSMFAVTNSAAVIIDGVCSNSATPSSFGDFTNVDGLQVSVVGCGSYPVGKVNTTRCFRVKTNMVDNSFANSFANDYATAQGLLGLDYLGLFATSQLGVSLVTDAAEFTGTTIVGSTGDYDPIFRVKPSPLSRHRDGMTFWFRAKATAALYCDIRMKTPSGYETIVANINLATTYAWYRVALTPESLAQIGVYLQINNTTMSGVNRITISEWYFEEMGQTVLAPITGVWEQGARRRNAAPAVGQPKGWICTVAGGSNSVTRGNTTAYPQSTWALWTTGTTIWECTIAGTSAGAPPSIVGKNPGDTVIDGTVTWVMRSLTTATWVSEGNL
jgi:hypothetical protein